MAGINEALEKFNRAPTKFKALGFIGFCLLLWGVFWYMFYSDATDQVAKLDREVTQLEEEKQGYEDKKQKYLALRSEVKKLEQEQKELIKILPTSAEIPNYLQTLHAQAELAGLNIQTFDRQPEVTEQFYAKIPVRMVINGPYHNIAKFMYSVGRLKRIVNIQDVLLSTPKADAQGKVILTAKFVASTFRFVEQKKQPTEKKEG